MKKHINPNCQCASCKSIRGEYIKETHPSFKIGLPQCIDCGKELSRYDAKRCKKCSRIGSLNINYKNGIHSDKPKTCNDCGKIIYYCSLRCKSCARQGNKHPNWKDGRSFEPYTAEFNDSLKEYIHKRDDYKCQNCGMTEEEHLIVRGTKLPIHHIDYNKQNSNENNLITLCNQCNIRANYNRDYWKEYYIDLLIKKVENK